jgi:hypothetical protein
MAVAQRESNPLGRVLTEATIENLKDLWDAERGLVAKEQIRRVTVPDALVDTGATLLSLPTGVIRQLGLGQTGTRRGSSSTGGARPACTRPYAYRSRGGPAPWT